MALAVRPETDRQAVRCEENPANGLSPRASEPQQFVFASDAGDVSTAGARARAITPSAPSTNSELLDGSNTWILEQRVSRGNDTSPLSKTLLGHDETAGYGVALAVRPETRPETERQAVRGEENASNGLSPRASEPQQSVFPSDAGDVSTAGTGTRARAITPSAPNTNSELLDDANTWILEQRVSRGNDTSPLSKTLPGHDETAGYGVALAVRPGSSDCRTLNV